MSYIVPDLLRLNLVERVPDGVGDVEGFVVDEAAEPLALEMVLHLREAVLDGICGWRVRHVVQRSYAQPRVHLLHHVGLVGGQIIHKKCKRSAAVGTAQVPEITAEVERVDGPILNVDQLDAIFLGHRCDHSVVSRENFFLIDLEVCASAAPLQRLHGGFREDRLVHVQDAQLLGPYLGQLVEEGLLPDAVPRHLALRHDLCQLHLLSLDAVLQI